MPLHVRLNGAGIKPVDGESKGLNRGKVIKAVWESQRSAPGGHLPACLPHLKNTQGKWKGKWWNKTIGGRDGAGCMQVTSWHGGETNRAPMILCGVRGLIWFCSSDMGDDRSWVDGEGDPSRRWVQQLRHDTSKNEISAAERWCLRLSTPHGAPSDAVAAVITPPLLEHFCRALSLFLVSSLFWKTCHHCYSGVSHPPLMYTYTQTHTVFFLFFFCSSNFVCMYVCLCICMYVFNDYCNFNFCLHLVLTWLPYFSRIQGNDHRNVLSRGHITIFFTSLSTEWHPAEGHQSSLLVGGERLDVAEHFVENLKKKIK